MNNIVFRNKDRYAIKHLLVEIGPNRLNTECENKRYAVPKRLSHFYLEHTDECTFLVYLYLDGAKKVMKLDKYDLPETGWIRVKIK